MCEKLTKEQKKLVEENHNLIYSFAHKNNLNVNEYYDILAIGLCDAAQTFDENRGAFSTVAYHCMKNRLYKYWDRFKNKNMIPENIVVSYDAPMAEDDSIGLGYYLDVLANSDSTYDIVESNILKTELLNIFNGADRVVLDCIVNGETYREIAKRIGCTHQMIGLRVKRIRKKCAEYLSKC